MEAVLSSHWGKDLAQLRKQVHSCGVLGEGRGDGGEGQKSLQRPGRRHRWVMQWLPPAEGAFERLSICLWSPSSWLSIYLNCAISKPTTKLFVVVFSKWG